MDRLVSDRHWAKLSQIGPYNVSPRILWPANRACHLLPPRQKTIGAAMKVAVQFRGLGGMEAPRSTVKLAE